MKELSFPGDLDFAQDIDLFCASCQLEKSEGLSFLAFLANQPQINNLRWRRDNLANLDEKKALEGLIQQCQKCNEGERNNSISLQYSCLWRR